MDFAKHQNETATMEDIYSQWSFTLSPFQKIAIKAIIDRNSTIITAHTGCGKTLPAEFAIKHYYEIGKKSIYTSPIKALTNEKYNDFTKKYPEISFGLITGDNTINPAADCLLMTTEIFRNTLFKMKMIKEGTIKKDNTLHFEMDIPSELGTVIFDEIHYINDPDRGPAWEESIMMLPNHIPLIGLSATLERPEKFIKWIRNKGLEVVLCGTNKRIVPLTHKAFITFPDSCIKKMSVQDKDLLEEYLNKPVVLKTSGGDFNDIAYTKMCKIFKILDKYKIHVDRYFVVNNLLKKLKEEGRLPAICFIFSKKQTWQFASKVSFSLFEEGSKIPSIIEQECKKILISKLDNWKEYVELPEFKRLMKCLEKGIGVHHAGIIGVFKEMMEILFHKGYIKVMFATTTLGIGINMPTKSVIYTSIMKFSGNKFNWLPPHEMSQISGRAGRRGIDDYGEVFHLLNLYDGRDNLPDSQTLRYILTGKSQAIETKFKIHFNLLLRLIAVKNYNFADFANSSMLCDEIDKRKAYIKEQLDISQTNLEKANNNAQFIQNREAVEEYIELSDKCKFMKPKKKKIISRRIQELSNYKMFQSDLTKYQAILTNTNMVKQYTKDLQNVSDFIDVEIQRRLIMLEQLEFIDSSHEEIPYYLTEKGDIAANIQEIHCLAMSEVIHNGYLNGLETEELVAVLSCFTPIRLNDTNKIWNISDIENCGDRVIQTIQKIKTRYDKYYDMETREETNFIYDYDMQYDTAELAYRWCFAENDIQCKEIFQEAEYYGIFVGEWIKVMLKINNISKELEKVCEITNNMELLEKLKKIPDVTLKSVVTNQSLYL